MRRWVKVPVGVLVLFLLVASWAWADEGEITVKGLSWVQEGSKVTVRGTLVNHTNRDISGVQLRFLGYTREDASKPAAEFRYDHMGLVSPTREEGFQFAFDCDRQLETTKVIVSGGRYR